MSDLAFHSDLSLAILTSTYSHLMKQTYQPTKPGSPKAIPGMRHAQNQLKVIFFLPAETYAKILSF